MPLKISVTVKRIPGKSSRVLVPSRSSIYSLLARLGINRETVVVRLNGKIAAESEKLAKGDKLEIISIVSGG